jgi:hypothetical protein
MNNLQKTYFYYLDKARYASYRWRWGREPGIVQAELMYHVYWYLGRYRYVLEKPTETVPVGASGAYPDKIWVCWLQGEDQAPHLVKRCIASIRANSGGRDVVVLTSRNLQDYIELPGYIMEKYERGLISNTHFSDILRISLLAQHGGLWVDATVWVTEPMPAYITEGPMFCFKVPIVAGPSPIKASNWLIAAQAGHPIIVKTREVLCEYWRHEARAKHYFIFHLIFALVCDSNSKMKRLWKSIPYFSNSNPHVLQFELFDEYNEKRYQEICRFSPLHKLTYKFPMPAVRQGQVTFYDQLFGRAALLS